MKRCLTSFVIRELQIKATMSCLLIVVITTHLLEWLKSETKNKTKIPIAGEDMENK